MHQRITRLLLNQCERNLQMCLVKAHQLVVDVHLTKVTGQSISMLKALTENDEAFQSSRFAFRRKTVLEFERDHRCQQEIRDEA